MAQTNQPLFSPFFVLFLLLSITTATTSAAVSCFYRSYPQYDIAISLSHSLLTRVSNLRAERGDIAGANRAKLIADKLEKGFCGSALSVGYDYVKNYSWKDLNYAELYGAVSELNKLASVLTELTRDESDEQRAYWVAGNYKNILSIAKSLLKRFLKVFHESGGLKEVVEMVQREVVDGELLRDCVELGSEDLKGLVQIIKDLASQVEIMKDLASQVQIIKDLDSQVQIIKDLASQYSFSSSTATAALGYGHLLVLVAAALVHLN